MITVLGTSGFIGSQLVNKLAALGLAYRAFGRGDVLPAESLGDVIYCIGLTADFRSRPLEAVEAHVCRLLEVVRQHQFTSLLYLSSTRLYAGKESTGEEEFLRVEPHELNDLYNLSKAMGESITLNCGRGGRVARIANAYGPDFHSDNFLSDILKRAVNREKIVLQTATDSAKDYISVDDVTGALIQIASSGKQSIYNVASGINVSHRELTANLQELTHCEIEFVAGAA